MTQRPKPDETLSLRQQKLIDSQCISFEDQLRSGADPTIEQFVSNVGPHERAELLYELLLIDLDYQRRQGTTPSREQYVQRFPDDADTVQAAFDASMRTQSAAAKNHDDQPPKKISRYEIVRPIGSGTFGVVYEAFDPKLQRPVAIKVQRPQTNQHASVELTEAQTIARLTHPNIVPVFDVGSTINYPCYIVSALIDGSDLPDRIRERKPTLEETVDLVARLADALDYAHEQGVIHRDVKPRNILIDNAGTPFLVDFGLALLEEDYATGPQMVGTPAYMSPEQAGGEGHRVDGRSDLFSLGSILYELLTGRRPFEDESVPALLKQVEQANPPPLAEFVAGLPKELQRVCSKAMARRVEDRYANGREFAADLRTALEAEYDSVVEQKVPRGVVPRGLRSYGAEDADFFLQLLPGPRDRRGLSRLLKQLLSRIEATAQGETFSTGIVFGPSGCGKSSLMKAGVLPRANARVKSIYFEATADNTTTDLRRFLQQQFQVPPDEDLRDTLSRLRRGEVLKAGQKLVIIIDQFEQWLHVNQKPAETELVTALRQCDGGRLQCVLMVRDDFWFAINRFMKALEIPILEGTNSFAVDLFDTAHARRILTSFGQAFERVDYPPTAQQKQFINQATDELLQGENISPVRLALFAEMMKNREWAPEILAQLGGADGVGLRFFEETFDQASGNTTASRNGDAIRRVLTSLLPESDTTIKGSARAKSELLLQCEGKQQQLDEVLRVLDRELRLITPVESETSGNQEPAFQLAHDYLVPSIRKWLARYQKETFAGRAEAKLIDRTAAWSSRRESQQLPSLWEYGNIRLFTEPKRWTERQRAMMSRASKHLLIRFGTLLTALSTLSALLFVAFRSTREQLDEKDKKRTQAVVSSFWRAAPAGVPVLVPALQDEGERALKLIRELEADSTMGPHERHRLVVGRSLLDTADIENLIQPDTLKTLPTAECPNLVIALNRDTDRAIKALRQAWTASLQRFRSDFPDDPMYLEVLEAKNPDDENLRILLPERLDSLRVVARYAILLMHLGEPETSQRMLAYSDYPEQRSAWIYEFQTWHGDLTELIDTLKRAPEPALISGLCMAIGAGKPTQAEKTAVGSTLQELFQSHTDAGVHSAAQYALKKWKLQTPTVLGDKANGWKPTEFDFTLSKIPAGSFTRFQFTKDKDASQQLAPKPQTVSVNHDFYIATTEVTVELFQRFTQDPNWPRKKKPVRFVNPGTKEPEDWNYHRMISRTTDCPVQQVNFDDVCLFCNWLSHQANLTQCYTTDGNGAWVFDETANGYRLPTASEWEYAARAGTKTFWFSGQDEFVLRDYASYVRTTDYGTQPCGSFFPNPFGLFDTSGNVKEWCWDRFQEQLPNGTDFVAGTGPKDPKLTNRICRGGCFTDRAEALRNDRRAGKKPRGPSSRQSRQGFRVVRNAN
jgi:serine/threonine protein kinase/formylglycine-generating enzyme required for sulfatase activity